MVSHRIDIVEKCPAGTKISLDSLYGIFEEILELLLKLFSNDRLFNLYFRNHLFQLIQQRIHIFEQFQNIGT